MRRKWVCAGIPKNCFIFLQILLHFHSELAVQGTGWWGVFLIKTTQILFSEMWLAGAHVALIYWDQIAQPSWI